MLPINGSSDANSDDYAVDVSWMISPNVVTAVRRFNVNCKCPDEAEEKVLV